MHPSLARDLTTCHAPPGGATFIDIEHGTVFQGSFNGRRLRWGVIARTSIRINACGLRQRQRHLRPRTATATPSSATVQSDAPSLATAQRPQSAFAASPIEPNASSSASATAPHREGDVDAYVVPRFATHPLLRLMPQPRFVVGSTYGWDVERSWATRMGASTLVDSGPRPIVLLVHHAVLLLFDLRPRYPQARCVALATPHPRSPPMPHFSSPNAPLSFPPAATAFYWVPSSPSASPRAGRAGPRRGPRARSASSRTGRTYPLLAMKTQTLRLGARRAAFPTCAPLTSGPPAPQSPGAHRGRGARRGP